MLKYKFIGLALFFKAVIGKVDFEAARLDVEQSKKYYNIERLGSVPVAEISGLTSRKDDIFMITDSGGKAAIYSLDNNLNIKDTFYIPNASNIDWETLTINTQGNFFIGDVGNNLNRRQNLRIYRLNKERSKTDTISFNYKFQSDYPPKKKQRNYDSEAMFWDKDQLHLFSKNRGRKCVKHYILPDQVGDYRLSPHEELKLNAMITGAAISGDEKTVALSGYGKIYFFKMAGGKIFSEPVMLIETTRLGQNEAITFLDEKTLLICNEAGKFYKVSFSLPENN